jgi:hypothetical protein
VRKTPEASAVARVAEVLELVELTALAERRPEVQLVDRGVIVESTFLGNSRSVVVESERLGRTTALLYDGEEPRDRGAEVSFGWEAKHALVING